MNPRPQECRGCPLDEVASGFAQPEGSGSLKILLTGEALGEQEAKDGLPFRPYAPAGAILQRTLKALGIDRQQVVINNIAMCRPPNNRFEHADWEVGAANHCMIHYWNVLQRFQPRVIVALGNVPLKHLTGYTGEKKTITNVRGFYLDGLRHPGIPVIGSYHPSFLQRDRPNLLGVLQTDLLRARLLAEAQGRFTRPERRYTIFPSLDEARRWLEDLRLHPELLVTYDIETMESMTGTSEDDLRALPDGRLEWRKTKAEFEEMPEHLIQLGDVEEPTEQLMIGETRITQIQFSARENEAIVLPFTGEYIQLAREVLALPNDKMGHNSRLFDDPLLRQAGVHVAGRRDDSMDAWHHLQADLPKGLQYVCSFYIPEAEPWKHTSDSDEGTYGGDDVAHLRKFGPRILQQLQDRGLWYGYDRQVRELGYVFDRATDLGIPMNNQKLDRLDQEIEIAQRLVGHEIQALVPDDLKNVEPKNGYVNPKIAEKAKARPLEEGERWIERQFAGPEGPVSRWCRLQPFLPNSSQQILRYIKWRLQEDIEIRVRGYQAQPRYQGHTLGQLEEMAARNTKWKVPKKFREDKETTSKVELVRLGRATGDLLFEKVIQYREYVKVRKTYVQGWRPKADGRVHGIFKFGPATGQMSSSNPNVQNSPAPKGPEGSNQRRIAEAFRQAIEAPPGFKIVTFDYKAFHVLTTGFEARCPTWMRLARLDMHSFVTGMFIREPWERWLSLPDEELAEILSRIKNQSTPRYEQLQTGFIRDRKAKPADLAIGFGARERKIYDLNQESFANLGEVKTFFSLLRQIGKEVFLWQDAVRRECHSINKGYLKTAYGYMRWFHDVYHWSSLKGAMEPGKDHEAVVAYRPANDAFGIKKDVELWLGDEGLDVKFGFANDVHDELFFVCPDRHVEECLHLVKAQMEAPSKRLVDPVLAPQGLWCEVEAKVGQNWGSDPGAGGMQKVKVPKAVIASGR